MNEILDKYSNPQFPGSFSAPSGFITNNKDLLKKADIPSSSKLFKDNKKCKLETKKQSSKNFYEAVIKRLSINMVKGCKEELNQIGIENIINFNKNEDYKLINTEQQI